MNKGLGAMEEPGQSLPTEQQRVYFVMNNTNGVWMKISDEYARVNDAVRALEQLVSAYPFARLGGLVVS